MARKHRVPKDTRSTDWLPKGPPVRESKIRLVRELWRMKGTDIHAVVASLYQVDTGLELRIVSGGDIVETQLSRTGEQPLLERAARLKQELVAGGWTELKGRA